MTVGRLVAFLAAMLLVGLLTVPRLVHLIARHSPPETLLVSSMGICFGTALLAVEAGYSVALGASMAGALVSESGEGQRVHVLIEPVRDIWTSGEMTGATVLAITRGETGLLVSTSRETLMPGNVLALGGTHDAVDAAEALLQRRAPVQ